MNGIKWPQVIFMSVLMPLMFFLLTQFFSAKNTDFDNTKAEAKALRADIDAGKITMAVNTQKILIHDEAIRGLYTKLDSIDRHLGGVERALLAHDKNIGKYMEEK